MFDHHICLDWDLYFGLLSTVQSTNLAFLLAQGAVVFAGDILAVLKHEATLIRWDG